MGDSELSYAEVEIERAAAACYRLLCEVARLPEWLPELATVDVIEADDQGRALLAEFVTMPGSGSLGYTLRYEYDDAARCVRWRTSDPDEREVRGEAVIDPAGADRCRLRYGLYTAVSGGPMWAAQALEKDKPTPVATAFRRWVERQPT